MDSEKENKSELVTLGPKNEKDDIVTLILDDCRLEASKGRLSSQSQYFACLFSDKFSDSILKEHIISYDIELKTLQDFIEWINEEMLIQLENSRFIKSCLDKYTRKSYADLVALLKLSVLYTCDNLTEDLIEVVMFNWFLPDHLINIWLLAKELGLKTLKNVSFAACLEKFTELPCSALTELSRNDFMSFVRNVNIKCKARYLIIITIQWIERNYRGNVMTVGRQLQLILGNNVMKNRKPNILACKLRREAVNDEQQLCVNYWGDDAELHSIRLKNVTATLAKIVGMQILGRGFSIYFIGGSYGLSSASFNDYVWRYCLLSEKLYRIGKLPRPRRHMVAVFIKQKLFLFGGIGKYRMKLTSVDVLNLQTGEWSQVADIPESFTNVPLTAKVCGHIVFNMTSFHVFDPFCNEWHTLRGSGSLMPDCPELDWQTMVRFMEYRECIEVPSANKLNQETREFIWWLDTTTEPKRPPLLRKDCIPSLEYNIPLQEGKIAKVYVTPENQMWCRTDEEQSFQIFAPHSLYKQVVS
ncbi:uncharacterized protein LOC105694180 isoform X2 [Orussus abietinus]|uniref:uncharacterized protein LOC105694180 isoform X2 n=1 Tax=Orussus abietinus TaxID=222816 RepID=UPI0006258E62|nr:uncharacterized protein LOC105694180 isoform X2 [Orussus abietinus]